IESPELFAFANRNAARPGRSNGSSFIMMAIVCHEALTKPCFMRGNTAAISEPVFHRQLRRFQPAPPAHPARTLSRIAATTHISLIFSDVPDSLKFTADDWLKVTGRYSTG